MRKKYKKTFLKKELALPVYFGGMSRGLLGAASPLQMRHDRAAAIREADLVLLAGKPEIYFYQNIFKFFIFY
jgi:hypothetical protein